MVIKLWRRKRAKPTDAKKAIARAEKANNDLERQRPEASQLSARLRALRHENHFEAKIRAVMEGGGQ
ncbi:MULTISPECIES: hypothetical protein [Streptomyces]|uniref:DUF7620 family protein n=1 Tax=Streptomyces TaxID=1883 RepID=UPI001672829C|nr:MULTISPECIES: hypothetical protein [Streptomyces]WGP08860.1 hypothetical protein QFA72_03820 [Streptomyces sp. SH5]GGP66986.1 hypothetical protein GCM10010231_42300 [Streptomyces sindenensis]